MAKITRKHQKVFAGDILPNNNIGQFGSYKAGTPVYSDDPDTIQFLANYGQGWEGALVDNKAPALQDLNAMHFLQTRQLAYLMQDGVPEWNTSTVYYQGSLAKNALGDVYRSKTDTNTGNALTNTTYWSPVSPNQCYVYSVPDGTPSGRTYTLDVWSAKTQVITDDIATNGNMTIKLPSTGVIAGSVHRFFFTRLFGDYSIAVQSSSGSAVQTLYMPRFEYRFVALQDTPTSNSHWLTSAPLVRETGRVTLDSLISGSNLTAKTGWGNAYMDEAGNWYLRFSIYCTTSTTTTALTLSISGVTFSTVLRQAVAACDNFSGRILSGTTTYTPNVIALFSATAGQVWGVSGDVSLASKPTWA